MPAPKGTRTKAFSINDTDAVHIYSNSGSIWLQLRRDHPTEQNIEITSFKASLNLSPTQAIAIAGELLSVASSHNELRELTPTVTQRAAPNPENHGKSWTEEKDKQLISRFHSKLSIEEIARQHKRGIGSIQSRLAKHGLDSSTRETK